MPPLIAISYSSLAMTLWRGTGWWGWGGGWKSMLVIEKQYNYEAIVKSSGMGQENASLNIRSVVSRDG